MDSLFSRKGQFLNVRGEKTSEAMFYEVLKNSIHNVWDNIKLNDYCCMESIILDNMNIPKGIGVCVCLWVCVCFELVVCLYVFMCIRL